MSRTADPDLEIGMDGPLKPESDTTPSEKQRPSRWNGNSNQPQENTEDDPIASIWKQVMTRNDEGHYNFERFESMQLLNLCLQQHELRLLAEEIYDVIGSGDYYPAAKLRGKVTRLKPMLKEYSRYLQNPMLTLPSDPIVVLDENLIAVHEIMAFQKAAFKTISPFDRTKVCDVPRLMARIYPIVIFYHISCLL
jgi:hypothetical protein